MKPLNFLRNIGFSCFLLALFSCQNEKSDADVKLIRISADITDDLVETKVDMAAGDESVTLKWNDGDVLVVSNGSTTKEYTICEGFTDKRAEFEGTALTGTDFNIYLSDSKGECLTHSFSGQVQNGNASIDHLKYDACILGLSSIENISFSQSWAESVGAEFRQSGCIKFHLQLPADITSVKTLKLCADDHFLTSTNTEGSNVAVLDMDINNVDLSASGNVLTAYMAIPMYDMTITSSDNLSVVIVTDEDKVYHKALPQAARTLKSGHLNVIKLNKNNWTNNTFKLMTYNIKHINGYLIDGVSYGTYDMFASIANGQDVDVVACNEVDYRAYRSGRDNQPYEMASAMGNGWAYQFYKAIDLGFGDYGNAILYNSSVLSKVSSYSSVLLPQYDNSEQRCLGVIELDKIIVCVTHLDATVVGQPLAQAQYITSWVKQNLGTSTKPIFLLGDMNSRPATDAIKEFKKDWRMISPDAPTFASGKCIDYIFVYDNNNARCQVLDGYVVTPEIDSDVSYLSDHYPVVVEVDITALPHVPSEGGSFNDIESTDFYIEAFE